jgi:hypothetical protein
MEKKTVIANIHAEIELSDDVQAFLTKFEDQENAWFARQGGNAFLSEFGGHWNSAFVEVSQSVFDEYFRSLDFPEDQLPKVSMTDSRRGSWIMDAALTMAGTVGGTYAILKAYADLPKVAEGLEETTKQLKKELSAIFEKRIPERIEPILSHAGISTPLPPPVLTKPVTVTSSIDARPLLGLVPDVAKSHSIHLSVAVSRSALSIENLGDSPIENLQIGLFKSTWERNNWNFGDAYSKSIPKLSGKQSTSFSIEQFSKGTDESLSLKDDSSLYVDCWLQDNSGIYLFNFYLE